MCDKFEKMRIGWMRGRGVGGGVGGGIESLLEIYISTKIMKEERWRVKISNEMWFNERLVEEYGEPGHEYIQKQEKKGEEKGRGE